VPRRPAPVSLLDPSAIPRFLLIVVTFGVRRFGWKWVGVGWAASTVLAVWLNYHY
jgi:hypothetical protein